MAGISERDRAEVSAELAQAQNAADFFGTLEVLAQHHLVERSMDDVGLCAEMVAEARRNPTIGKIMRDFDVDVRARLTAMLHAAAERGDISRTVKIDDVVTTIILFADGVWWRRAVHPDFDPASTVPIFMSIVRFMLLGQQQRGEKQGEIQ